MADQNDEKGASRRETFPGEFTNFLEGFSGLARGFAQNARQLVEEEQLLGLADIYGNVLANEIGGLTEQLTELVSSIDRDSAREASRFLRQSGGSILVEQASNLVGPDRIRSASALGRFGGIFEAVKKIITHLVDLIFGGVPRWLDKLLHIIDNLIGLLAGLFSEDAQDYYYRLERNELQIRKDLQAIGA